MEARELRIGNWVRIVGIYKTSIDRAGLVKVDADLIKLADSQKCLLIGEALTPEILEKAGFKINDSYDLSSVAVEYILKIPVNGDCENIIRFLIKHDKKICFGNYTTNGFWSSNNFKYVHQLQNLYFALTGEELNIEL